jgi:hypothetical protein
MKTIRIGKSKYRLLITAKKETLESSYVLIQEKKLFSKWETAQGTDYMLYTDALKILAEIRGVYEWEQEKKKCKNEFANIPEQHKD